MPPKLVRFVEDDLVEAMGELLNSQGPQQQRGLPPTPPGHAPLPIPPRPVATAGCLHPKTVKPGKVPSSWDADFDELINPKKRSSRKRDFKTAIYEDNWLQNEKHWKHRVGSGWVAKRVLGKGGMGIVGHWSYEGPDRDQKALKDVAVKQALYIDMKRRKQLGLHEEARWLEFFGKSKSPHILRMYRRVYEEKGTGSGEPMDQGTVHRIFLEFCPGGTLQDFLDRHIRIARHIDEYDIWCIFHCFARAVMVLWWGHEDYANQPRRTQPDKDLVHFDIKPENILLGETLLDLEHRDKPAYKLADFGIAHLVPQPHDERALWQLSFFGTPGYFLPEQMHRLDHPQFKDKAHGVSRPWIGRFTDHVKVKQYSHASNIWAMGMIIHILMRHEHFGYPKWPLMKAYRSNMTERLRNGGYTIGTDRDLASERDPDTDTYSRSLRALVAECILSDPSKRVSPIELLTRTQRGLEISRNNQPNVPQRNAAGMNLQGWQEPVISDRWKHDYSVNKEREEELARQTAADIAVSAAHANQTQNYSAPGQPGGSIPGLDPIITHPSLNPTPPLPGQAGQTQGQAPSQAGQQSGQQPAPQQTGQQPGQQPPPQPPNQPNQRNQQPPSTSQPKPSLHPQHHSNLPRWLVQRPRRPKI